VHSVYSDEIDFLCELISDAVDACGKLRYEAMVASALLGDDSKARRDDDSAVLT
jgi:molecular chaperone HtpG